MNDKLKQFYETVDVREELYAYIQKTLDTYALDRLYQKQDVTGIADAKAVFEKLKKNLELDYSMKKQVSLKQNQPV